MKNKKTKYFIVALVALGVFIIIYASLGAAYFSKHQEKQDLTGQVVLKQSILQKPKADVKDLEARLAQAKADLANTKVDVPGPTQGIEIYNALIALGLQNNIEILSVQASSSIAPAQGETETALPYSITLRGSEDDVFNYVSNLVQGNGPLRGLELQNINFQSGDKLTMAINLNIHAWPDTYSQNLQAQLDGGIK